MDSLPMPPEPILKQLLREGTTNAVWRVLGFDAARIRTWREQLGIPEPWQDKDRKWHIVLAKVVVRRWNGWVDGAPNPITQRELEARVDGEAGAKKAGPKLSPACPVDADAVVTLLAQHPNSTEEQLAELGGWPPAIVSNILFGKRGAVVKNHQTGTYRVYEPPTEHSYTLGVDALTQVRERTAVRRPHFSAGANVSDTAFEAIRHKGRKAEPLERTRPEEMAAPFAAKMFDHKPRPESEVLPAVAHNQKYDWPEDKALMDLVAEIEGRSGKVYVELCQQIGCPEGSLANRLTVVRRRLGVTPPGRAGRQTQPLTEPAPVPIETGASARSERQAAEILLGEMEHPAPGKPPVLVLMDKRSSTRHDLEPTEYLPKKGDQWPKVERIGGRVQVRVWFCWDAFALDSGREIRLMIPAAGIELKPEEVA